MTPIDIIPGGIGMTKASDVQVGGSHYKNMPVQPWHFCQRNKIPYGESCVIKYLCRHREKNGAEDLRKAIHNIEMILEDEYGSDDSEVAETGVFKDGDGLSPNADAKGWMLCASCGTFVHSTDKICVDCGAEL